MNTYIEERTQLLIEHRVRPQDAQIVAESDWKTHVISQAAQFYAGPYLPAQELYSFGAADKWMRQIATRFERLHYTQFRRDGCNARIRRRLSAEYYQLRDSVWLLSKYMVQEYFPFYLTEWEKAQ